MEKWIPVYGSSFYQISNFGNIRRIQGSIIKSNGKTQFYRTKILKQAKDKDGYLTYNFRFDVNKNCRIHRVVLEMFSPIDNMNMYQVNHINGTKTNNMLSNLEWVTQTENMIHAQNLGLYDYGRIVGEKHHNTSLSHKDVVKIRELTETTKYTNSYISKLFNTSDATVSRIRNGKTRIYE